MNLDPLVTMMIKAPEIKMRMKMKMTNTTGMTDSFQQEKIRMMGPVEGLKLPTKKMLAMTCLYARLR